MTCNNLITYYNPSSGSDSITDLTSQSTDAIKRNIIQYNLPLYGTDGKSIGNLLILNSSCTYENNPNVSVTIATYSFTINNNGFVEIYSAIFPNTSVRNESGFVTEYTERLLNLTSVEGNQSYKKLKWILQSDKEGTPITRTLIFYN
jgi:hypothetical protein